MASAFTERVYALARTIPAGKVATYGQLARLAGNPRAARAVGMAMRCNPDIPATPCHRVVASDGSLTGYSAADGVSTKRTMLEREGVTFRGSKADLMAARWEA